MPRAKFIGLVLFLTIPLCLFVKFLFGQVCCEDEFLKFPLKTILTYCQTDTTTPISINTFTYDKENRLSKSSLFNDNVEKYRTIYNYNENGLLTSKDFYFLNDTMTLDRTRVFNYDENDRLINEGFNDSRDNNTQDEYTYNSNGQLSTSTADCNYTHWEYLYGYDKQNRLTEKWKNNKLQIYYEYSGDYLVKETEYDMYEKVSYVRTYEYNDDGLLIIKKENDKIIEKNIYKNGRLIERWTYYFGNGPGFYPCRSQYVTKFEYF